MKYIKKFPSTVHHVKGTVFAYAFFLEQRLRRVWHAYFKILKSQENCFKTVVFLISSLKLKKWTKRVVILSYYFLWPMPVERNNIISFYVNFQMLCLGRERWGFGFRPSATFFLFSSFHELSEANSLHSRYHNQLCLGSEYHHLYKVDRNSVTLRYISECMYLCMSTTRSLSEGVHLEFLQLIFD